MAKIGIPQSEESRKKLALLVRSGYQSVFGLGVGLFWTEKFTKLGESITFVWIRNGITIGETEILAAYNYLMLSGKCWVGTTRFFGYPNSQKALESSNQLRLGNWKGHHHKKQQIFKYSQGLADLTLQNYPINRTKKKGKLHYEKKFNRVSRTIQSINQSSTFWQFFYCNLFLRKGGLKHFELVGNGFDFFPYFLTARRQKFFLPEIVNGFFLPWKIEKQRWRQLPSTPEIWPFCKVWRAFFWMKCP